jgi:mono/diheme cytochrome c family protein
MMCGPGSMPGARAAWMSAALALLVVAGAGAALLASPTRPAPPGPEPGRTLYQTHCATCHGADGRGGTWRARLVLLRPGNLASPETATLPDQYLVDIIRHGGANFGKPGMPSFGFALDENEIRALVVYLRMLPPPPPAPRARPEAPSPPLDKG